jgi:hypothetical protein
MRRLVLVAAAFAAVELFAPPPASANVIGVTSKSALGASDFFNMAQLGPDETIYSGSATIVSNSGNTTAVVTPSNGSWITESASDSSIPGQSGIFSWLNGAFTITFSTPVSGVGTSFVANSWPYGATITAFDNSSVVGTFTEDQSSSGSPIYIGLSNNGAINDITSVTISLANYGDPSTFEFGQLDIADATDAPEPASLSLFGVALFGLGMCLRGRRQRCGV